MMRKESEEEEDSLEPEREPDLVEDLVLNSSGSASPTYRGTRASTASSECPTSLEKKKLDL